MDLQLTEKEAYFDCDPRSGSEDKIANRPD